MVKDNMMGRGQRDGLRTGWWSRTAYGRGQCDGRGQRDGLRTGWWSRTAYGRGQRGS